MRMRSLTLIATILMVHQLAFADASYEHTEQINGGQLVDMLKNMPMVSKQMETILAPVSVITMVHGNQKAVVSANSTDITDLDKQVVIHIDNTSKTYNIVTFDEMRKMMTQMMHPTAEQQQQLKDAQARVDQARAQMPQSTVQTAFTVSVSDPGIAKMVNGKNAKLQVLTMNMTATDPSKPGYSVVYSTTSQIWTTPELPAEMKEVQDFETRYAEMLMKGVDTEALKASMQQNRVHSSAAMGQMFGSKPGAAEAYAQMGKEMAKITGTHILEVTRMGGQGTGIAAPPANNAAAPATPSSAAPAAKNGNSVAGQVAGDAATQTAAGESSRLGIPGSALGSALMNAWNRKKAAPKPATPAPAPAATVTPPATTSAQTTTDVTLMEMTTQTSNFSSEAIPPSIFQVPDGYKLVPSPMEQMRPR